jgi:hypothetical protein
MTGTTRFATADPTRLVVCAIDGCTVRFDPLVEGWDDMCDACNAALDDHARGAHHRIDPSCPDCSWGAGADTQEHPTAA